MRFMNSGENLRRAASMPARETLPPIASSTMPAALLRSLSPVPKPRFGRSRLPISLAPRLLVMKISAREKSTRRIDEIVGGIDGHHRHSNLLQIGRRVINSADDF